jgi:hypothetical protein
MENVGFQLMVFFRLFIMALLTSIGLAGVIRGLKYPIDVSQRNAVRKATFAKTPSRDLNSAKKFSVPESLNNEINASFKKDNAAETPKLVGAPVIEGTRWLEVKRGMAFKGSVGCQSDYRLERLRRTSLMWLLTS